MLEYFLAKLIAYYFFFLFFDDDCQIELVVPTSIFYEQLKVATFLVLVAVHYLYLFFGESVDDLTLKGCTSR